LDFLEIMQMSIRMQISAIMGSCVAGGAYLHIIDDPSLLRAQVVYSLQVITW
jgi:acetyl-CoA carboxylase carboxyltransferase component